MNSFGHSLLAQPIPGGCFEFLLLTIILFTNFAISLLDATITGFLCTRENPFELVVDPEPPGAHFLVVPKP
ncbi:hypothetical protein Droror1_Dr00002204, partial [Drosera rotundifolia]